MRKSAALSQVELAERSRIRVAYIGRIERALANPTLVTIRLLADGLGCELADLFPREITGELSSRYTLNLEAWRISGRIERDDVVLEETTSSSKQACHGELRNEANDYGQNVRTDPQLHSMVVRIDFRADDDSADLTLDALLQFDLKG